MNENLDIDLDRLVDGELSTREYKQLLTMLDAQPHLWRRCALAFIEAQALGGELRSLRSAYLAPAVTMTTQDKESALPSRRQPWLIALAMAASFLIALPLGGYVFAPARQQAAPLIVDAPQAPPRFPQDAVVNASTSPLGSLRLTTDEGPIDIPYYDMQNGAKYLRDEQDALEEQLVQSLQSAGHRIERAPTVMPVALDNGTQVYLPVDNYRITPVSNRPVQ